MPSHLLSIPLSAIWFGLIATGSLAATDANADTKLNAKAVENRLTFLVHDQASLLLVRNRIAANDPSLRDAVEQLKADAQTAMQAGPFTVMSKKHIPPSGDKHDYMSVGPYWWPNPKTDDGLPYIRRDGNANPQRDDYDSKPRSAMEDAVNTLAMSWYLTRNESHAARAAKLLRVWFLDETTRMNPHLNFGQAIPGRTKGRGVGTIDTRHFILLIDSINMLRDSKAWTDADHAAMKKWFRQFGAWLRDSDHGKSAHRARNNIGTWYDAQTAAVSIFAGDVQAAKVILQTAGERRYAQQIAADGRLPHELSRTRSFEYVAMNLTALLTLARLGDHVGIDLWRFKGDDGRNLQRALDWFAPYASGEKKWPHKQIKTFALTTTERLYRVAAHHYDSDIYRAVARRIGDRKRSSPTLKLTTPIIER